MDKWEHKLSVKVGEEKVEMNLTADLTGLDLDNFVKRGLSDFAANAAKPVRDGLKSAEEFISEFQDAVARYSRGETARREGGAAKVDSTESLIIRTLAAALKDKDAAGTLATAKVAVPQLDNPPKTEKGHINYNAWAKILREGEHPWYGAIAKQVKAQMGKLD